MKFAISILLLTVCCSATGARAQTNNIPQVQHVILVIQENRSPDNLFGSDAFRKHPKLPPGADLAQQGKCLNKHTHADSVITLTPWTMDACFDPNHGHDQDPPINDAWVATYNKGNMDGACNDSVIRPHCGPSCPLAGY